MIGLFSLNEVLRSTETPGRGHYDKDRPAIIAWVSRQGAVVIQATRDFTVKTVQKAADLAVHAGSRLYTDSASSYRAVKGYVHAFVNHTQKEYARGDVHENRAECLFSLLKPYLRVFRGISKLNLPGYVSFFQFLWNVRHQNACEQAEMILRAALDPVIASKARRGEFVKCLDHFDLLQTAIN
jgi:transposase